MNRDADHENGIYTLRPRGRGHDAAALAAMMQVMGPTLKGGVEIPARRNKPHISIDPPPAKNRPCPCGSGRKYKKCCGKR